MLVYRNPRFDGRSTLLADLENKLMRRGRFTKVAVVGLGIIGKTLIMRQLAYRTSEKFPRSLAFWVPARSYDIVRKAYVDRVSRSCGCAISLGSIYHKRAISPFVAIVPFHSFLLSQALLPFLVFLLHTLALSPSLLCACSLSLLGMSPLSFSAMFIFACKPLLSLFLLMNTIFYCLRAFPAIFPQSHAFLFECFMKYSLFLTLFITAASTHYMRLRFSIAHFSYMRSNLSESKLALRRRLFAFRPKSGSPTTPHTTGPPHRPTFFRMALLY
jgi:hypothetical protein